MRKVPFRLSLLLIVVLLLAACGQTAPATTSQPAAQPDAAQSDSGSDAASAGPYTIATVVKISGINWFDRMEQGVARFGQETGHTTFQQGPEQADAALQLPIIENLIAQQVDAITVVPMSPETLEPVLQKAMEAGIIVVTHEASNQQNMHYDIEAFDNAAYGAHLMDALAERMGGEGKYAVFVGSLTSKTHNEWVDAAIARQQEMYPNMELIVDKQETYDDSQTAYERTREILRAHPDIRGFQGSASTDVAGIGQAIEEAGLADQTVVVGTSLPSIAGDLLDTGAVDMISFWDPADAGFAMNKIAEMLLNGETIEAGMDLGIPGYNSITIDGRVIYGQAWVDVTSENKDDYPF